MEQFKVIFTGLANAGKSSILNVLNKQFHKLANMVPTMGVERSLSTILGFQVTSWDLGGQDQYRTEYLTTKQETLLEADLMVFVVDMQDWNNYKESLDYYKKVLEIIKGADEHPYIVICLHKLDPEVYNDYKKNIADIMKLFEEASQEWEYKFFITSIYNRRSIVEAFSFGITQFLPKKKSLDLILRNFIAEAKELGEKVMGTMLWDQNALFLSMIFEDKKTEKASLNASMGILETIESFEKSGTFSSLFLEINKDYQFLVRKVGKVYTTIVGNQLDLEKVWDLYDNNYLTDLEELIERSE
jgi:GTP-binding protein EngB required for normal cell division